MCGRVTNEQGACVWGVTNEQGPCVFLTYSVLSGTQLTLDDQVYSATPTFHWYPILYIIAQSTWTPSQYMDTISVPRPLHTTTWTPPYSYHSEPAEVNQWRD